MNLTPQVLANVEPIEESTLTGEALQAAYFAALKKETRQAVVACHAMYREMYGMDSPLAILGWITTWMRGWGLTEGDAMRILKAMTRPERVAELKNATSVKTMMANYADDYISHRRMEEEASERRKQREEYDKNNISTSTDAHKTIVNDLSDKFGVK
jgi:hypothetical protein